LYKFDKLQTQRPCVIFPLPCQNMSLVGPMLGQGCSVPSKITLFAISFTINIITLITVLKSHIMMIDLQWISPSGVVGFKSRRGRNLQFPDRQL